MDGQLIIFHLIIYILFLSTVSSYNKLNKSKNHPSTFVYYLLFVKWNFVFILKNSSPAKT